MKKNENQNQNEKRGKRRILVKEEVLVMNYTERGGKVWDLDFNVIPATLYRKKIGDMLKWKGIDKMKTRLS